MALNGSAIRKQTFRKKFQGIDPAEVARFLDEVATDVDRLSAENAELSRKAAELETQLKDFRSVEKALQQTLMQAQDSTARSIDQARREAQLIIQDAEMKGAGILEKSRNELSALKEQITILAAKRDSLVSRLKMLLASELDMVNAFDAADAGGAPAGDDTVAAAEERSARPDDIEDIVKSLDQS
jgi:cell division initiation protein